MEVIKYDQFGIDYTYRYLDNITIVLDNNDTIALKKEDINYFDIKPGNEEKYKYTLELDIKLVKDISTVLSRLKDSEYISIEISIASEKDYLSVIATGEYNSNSIKYYNTYPSIKFKLDIYSVALKDKQ